MLLTARRGFARGLLTGKRRTETSTALGHDSKVVRAQSRERIRARQLPRSLGPITPRSRRSSNCASLKLRLVKWPTQCVALGVFVPSGCPSETNALAKILRRAIFASSRASNSLCIWIDFLRPGLATHGRRSVVCGQRFLHLIVRNN